MALLVPFALHLDTGRTLHPTDTDQPDGLVCTVCCARVIHRRRSCDGRRRAHYAHAPTEARNCPLHTAPESAEHLAAKLFVTARLNDIRFQAVCCSCGRAQEDEIEFRTQCAQPELPCDRWRLDVGVIDTRGSVVAAVEVRHTHAVPDDKARALRWGERRIRVLEVVSRDVLSAEVIADSIVLPAVELAAPCAKCVCRRVLSVWRGRMKQRRTRVQRMFTRWKIAIHRRKQVMRSVLSVWRDTVTRRRVQLRSVAARWLVSVRQRPGWHRNTRIAIEHACCTPDCDGTLKTTACFGVDYLCDANKQVAVVKMNGSVVCTRAPCAKPRIVDSWWRDGAPVVRSAKHGKHCRQCYRPCVCCVAWKLKSDMMLVAPTNIQCDVPRGEWAWVCRNCGTMCPQCRTAPLTYKTLARYHRCIKCNTSPRKRKRVCNVCQDDDGTPLYGKVGRMYACEDTWIDCPGCTRGPKH